MLTRKLTFGIKGRYTMMVRVDLVYWRCVAPANCFLSQPVEAMFAHLAKNSLFIEIEQRDYCDGDGDESDSKKLQGQLIA